MHAMKKAKMAALKDLIKQMRKMEAGEYMDKARGPSTDQMADVEEDDIEDADVDMDMPKSLAQGEVAGSDDDDEEDEKIPGMKSFMKRSSSMPIKGKTKSVMIAISAKPGRVSKKG